MTSNTTSYVGYRHLVRPGRQIGFGPYLLIESVPWLFLAMTLRTVAFALPPPLLFLFYYSAQFVLLLAFLIASERMIAIAGGMTTLNRLTMAEQWGLSWAVVWRMIAVGLVATRIAMQAGMNADDAARFVQGFDGIAFNRYFDLLLVWSPLVAAIAFLMLVEKGTGRPATLRGSLRSFLARWRYMLGAVLFAVPCIFLLNALQSLIGPVVGRLMKSFLPDRFDTFVVIFFLFVFAYMRLWLTVALLTYAVRRSYRETT